jgi:GDP-4-dehydro-6-deoxy-D-mannose reductase
MHTVLITGVNGFVGHRLAKELKSHGIRVYGLGQEQNTSPTLVPILDKYIACDLTVLVEVAKLPLEEISSIVNLAGLANVGASFGKEDLYQKVNVGVLKNLMAVIRKKNLNNIRVLAVSTGAVYDPNQTMPLTEESKLVSLQSTSPYVASKIAMESVAKQAYGKGLKCIIVRPFNHIGPGQLPGFLIPDLVSKLIAVKDTKVATITVGNLKSQRDYTDVRDVVAAYGLLATSDIQLSPVYNICSGTPVSGDQILQLAQKRTNTMAVSIEIDLSLIRPNDPSVLYGSHDLLTKDTGWEPKIPIEQTISDFVALEKSV